jgi:hypothetical protein
VRLRAGGGADRANRIAFEHLLLCSHTCGLGHYLLPPLPHAALLLAPHVVDGEGEGKGEGGGGETECSAATAVQCIRTRSATWHAVSSSRVRDRVPLDPVLELAQLHLRGIVFLYIFLYVYR